MKCESAGPWIWLTCYTCAFPAARRKNVCSEKGLAPCFVVWKLKIKSERVHLTNQIKTSGLLWGKYLTTQALTVNQCRARRSRGINTKNIRDCGVLFHTPSWYFLSKRWFIFTPVDRPDCSSDPESKPPLFRHKSSQTRQRFSFIHIIWSQTSILALRLSDRRPNKTNRYLELTCRFVFRM